MTKKRIIDVDEVIALANAMALVNESKDLALVEFHYDGRVIAVPASEIERFEFTGLSTMDFVLSRDWPDNPAYDTNA